MVDKRYPAISRVKTTPDCSGHRRVGYFPVHHTQREACALLTGFRKREAAQGQAADRASSQAITAVRTDSVGESLSFILKSPTKI